MLTKQSHVSSVLGLIALQLLLACRAVLVPVVLFLSVLLLLMIRHKLRTWRCTCTKTHQQPDESANAAVREQPAWPAFRGYIGAVMMTTWLVTYYNYYPTTAKAAVGMLMCLNVGAGNGRWIMDVRLQCPMPVSLGSGWFHGVAMAVGIVLVVFCVCMPAVIAGILIHQARVGGIGPRPDDGTSKSVGARMAAYASLSYRYADYKVDFGVLNPKSTAQS